MDRNSHIQPMDYQYDNGRGRIDENSPFITATKSSVQQNGRGDNKPSTLPLDWQAGRDTDYLKSSNKRRFGVFETSPTKSSQFPSLRPAANQPTYFSDLPPQEKPLPKTPARAVADFTTPRKPFEFQDSSGGETPDTVDNNADNEATPDFSTMGLQKRMKSLFSGGSKSPVKEMALARANSGKGEILKPYSKGVQQRIEKKRSRERNIMGIKRARFSKKDSCESDSEAGAQRSASSNLQPPPPQTSTIASFFSYIETHPQLPHLLSFYAQFLLNLFFVFLTMWIVYSFWATIKSDVDEQSQKVIAETLGEMAICAKHYRDNRCDGATRVPAMETVCTEWEKCMAQDPKLVGRARVSAHTFAQIFNSFIEPISYKAMIFTMILIFGCLFVSNVAFGVFRNKALHNDPYMHPPPPTPQRHPSGGFDQYGMGVMGMYNTPYGLHQSQWGPAPNLEPAASGSWDSPSKRDSPSKQLLEYRS